MSSNGKEERASNHAAPLPHLQEAGHSSALRSFFIVATCTMAMVVNASNNTAVAIALPTIERDLHIRKSQLQWVVSAYAISSGCLLLVLGRLSDLYGRKRVFVLGSLWLSIFCLGCGFAQNELSLDILRGIQGIGASATIPAAVGILAQTFPPSRSRAVAFAFFSAGQPLGAAFGMAIGGVMTELTAQSWRSVFYLLTGLNALCALGGALAFPADVSSEKDRRIDWIGAALITCSFTLIVFVLAQGELAPAQWRTPYVIALLIVSVLLLAGFLYWQHFLEKIMHYDMPRNHHTPPPLMKLSLWRRGHGIFSVVMAIGFLQWCAFFAWAFWIQLFYQEYMHLSPLLTVARLIPMFVVGLICNGIMALVVSHIPFVFIIATGTLCTSAACLLLALIVPSAPYWAFGFPSAILSVVGADFVFAAGSIYVAKVSKPEEQSLSGGIFATMGQLGSAVGIAVSTIVFDVQAGGPGVRGLPPPGPPGERPGTFGPPPAFPNMADGLPPPHLPPPPTPERLLNAYQAAQWCALAFGVIATLLAVIFLRRVGVVGEKKAVSRDSKEEGKNSNHAA